MPNNYFIVKMRRLMTTMTYRITTHNTMLDFEKSYPPMFSGYLKPTREKNQIDEMERIFETLKYLESTR